MNRIKFNRKDLSRFFWSVVFENSESLLYSGWPELRSDLFELDGRRSQATYDTGSINLATAFSLFTLISYLRPTVVAEVGTFIGKSTLSIARAMENDRDGVVHTCDMSNSINLDLHTSTRIVQYKLQSSSQMFKSLNDARQKVDLIALDGRLGRDDLPHLSGIVGPATVYVLDDFEGIEKGIANAFFLTGSDLTRSHLIIYPPDSEMLGKYMIRSVSTTAVLLPTSLVAYTAQ